MKQGKSNLQISIGVLSKFIENSKTNYHLEENQMIKILGSKGIKSMPTKKFFANINAGSEWKIENFIKGNILAVEENIVYNKFE